MKMAHHAGPSGYHRLAEYLSGQHWQTPTQLSPAARLCTRATRAIWQNSGLQWYFRENLMAEWQLLRLPRPKRVHFLYGENSFRYLPKGGRWGAEAILATIHTPEERFFQVVRSHDHLKRLDAAVVMSSVQIEFLQKLLGHQEVHFIPHGIDTDYYQPDAPLSEQDGVYRFVCVGSHLRDHETLIRCAKTLKAHDKIRFSVVSQAQKRDLFAPHPNIDFHSGVSDDKLRELYQQADALCLPLLDCTANNAILEGMACGLPVISTEMQGTRDYTCSDNRLLLPKADARALSEAIVGFTEDAAQRKRMRDASIQLAQRFSWQSVAEEMNQLYRRFS